ncbi:hypothetical protein V6N13_122445 [Hibiscus sabdariffa]
MECVDPTTARKLVSYKDIVIGPNDPHRGFKNVDLDDHEIELLEDDMTFGLVNSIPTIDFFERLKNLVIKSMDLTLVVKLPLKKFALRLTLGIILPLTLFLTVKDTLWHTSSESNVVLIKSEMSSYLSLNALHLELEQILDQDELLWKQNSHYDQISFGDRNTSYFHKRVTLNNRMNCISKLQLAIGEWCDNDETLHEEAILFYQNLFSIDS